MDGFNRVCKKGYEMTYPDLTEEQSKRAQEFSRAQVEAMCTYTEAERRLTELKEENAKLRSKARHMYVCIQHASYDEHTCESCPYDNENGACDFEKQLGELGIEVPK